MFVLDFKAQVIGMDYKILHDRENCIGCAACASMCPDFWSMADDGKSKLVNSKKVGGNEELEIDEKDFKCNKNAADGCPVNVIHLFDKNGKKLI